MVVTRLTLNLCSTLHLLKGWNPLKCWSCLLGSDTAKPVRSPLGFSCGLLIGKTWSEITCPWLFLVPQGFHCLFYTSSLLFSGGSLWEIKIYSTDSFFLCSIGSRDSRTDAPFGSQLHPALERSPGMLYLGLYFSTVEFMQFIPETLTLCFCDTPSLKVWWTDTFSWPCSCFLSCGSWKTRWKWPKFTCFGG